MTDLDKQAHTHRRNQVSKEMRQLARLMREWVETHSSTPAHKVLEWADAIVAANGPVPWDSPRELTLEEVRAEKALYKVYQRIPGARTPYTAWLRRATIAANAPNLPGAADRVDVAKVREVIAEMNRTDVTGRAYGLLVPTWADELESALGATEMMTPNEQDNGRRSRPVDPLVSAEDSNGTT